MLCSFTGISCPYRLWYCAFVGRGKKTCWETWRKFPDVTKTLWLLFHTPPTILNSAVKVLERFLCCCMTAIVDVRLWMLLAKSSSVAKAKQSTTFHQHVMHYCSIYAMPLTKLVISGVEDPSCRVRLTGAGMRSITVGSLYWWPLQMCYVWHSLHCPVYVWWWLPTADLITHLMSSSQNVCNFTSSHTFSRFVYSHFHLCFIFCGLYPIWLQHISVNSFLTAVYTSALALNCILVTHVQTAE